MNPNDYQRTMNNAYWEQHTDELQRLREQNRKLRWTVVALLVVGTFQWIAGWL